MRYVSMYDVEKDEYYTLTTHEDIRMIYVMKDWCKENEVENFLGVVFRDLKDSIISPETRLRDLPTIPSFPTVVKINVQRIEKTGEILTTLLKPDTYLSSASWTVEPTTGEKSNGRWIARPILDMLTTSYQVMVGLVFIDKEVEFSPVSLAQGHTLEHVRKALSREKDVPIEDLFYCYEWGSINKTDEGLKHATTFCITGFQRRMDDDFNVKPEDSSSLNSTIRIIYDDSRFTIPLAGGPLWIFHVANRYFALSSDQSAPYRLLEDQMCPLNDTSALCFVDGFFFEDLSCSEPRTPRLFASLGEGDAFADVLTGQFYESRVELSKTSVQDEVAEENRRWGSFVFVFFDGEPMPPWKVPDVKDLQVHYQPHLKLRIQNGCLVSNQPRGEVNRWHVGNDPIMEESCPGISAYLRSLMATEEK